MENVPFGGTIIGVTMIILMPAFQSGNNFLAGVIRRSSV